MINRVDKELMYTFSLIVVFLEVGGVYAFGAAFDALLENYQRDRSTTATVQSLLLGVTLSFGIISGTLISRLGLPLVLLVSCILVPAGYCSSFFATRIEHLYVSIGIVSGIGVSLAYTSSAIVNCRLFTGQKRDLYLSIQTAIIPFAGFVYPYILEWLIESYALNGTFLLLGAIYSNKIPFLIICFRNRKYLAADEVPENNDIAGNEKDAPIKKAKKGVIINAVQNLKQMMNITFSLILLATAVSTAGTSGFMGLALDISLWKGFTKTQGLLTFVIYNIGNTLSRLVPGFLKQIQGVDFLMFSFISALAGCIGQLTFFFGSSYSAYLIGFCLTGLCFGGIVSSTALVLVEIVIPERLPIAMGITSTTCGILSVSTGPFFGWLRDILGSYNLVIIIIATLQAITAILLCIVLIYRRIDTNKKKKIQQERRNTVSCTVSEL